MELAVALLGESSRLQSQATAVFEHIDSPDAACVEARAGVFFDATQLAEGAVQAGPRPISG